jgi:flagellar motor protein MotB
VQVTIDAHVDGPRRGATAWTRSALEGAEVADALVGRFGVPAARVSVAAHGDSAPVSVGDTPEGRALNHRIVLIVTEMR